MRKLASVLVLAAFLPLAGCFMVMPPAVGSIWADVKYDGHAHGSLAATKEGRACARSILGVFAQGDASIEAAAKAGGIKTVASIDHTAKVMVVIGEYCTIVRGS
jgi:hypothetical protein